MDYRDIEGSWWLPGDSQRIPGTLIYSSDGISLRVFGSLRPTEEVGSGITLGFAKWVVTPLVYGESRDGKEITLLEVSGLSTLLPSQEETHRVGLALVGQHLSEPKFTGIRASFEYLAEWADAPSIHTYSRGADPVLHPNTVELAIGEWDNIELAIKSGAEGRMKESSVHFERWCSFYAQSQLTFEWRELFERYARPFHDLLIISLGRPLSMTQVALKPSGSVKWCEAYFETRQSTGPVDEYKIHSYSAPTLLFLQSATMPACDLLSKWFELRKELRESLTLLLAPFYAPFTYEEHRFASYFQSLEAYHGARKSRYGSAELPKPDHRQRVAAVISALEDAHLTGDVTQWAKNVIQGRNDKPLSKRVEDVVRSTGTLGEELLSAAPDFCKNAARARTGVSHGGANGGLDLTSRHWHGEILLWIMRARILLDLGVRDACDRVRKRDAYQFALKQIRDSEAAAGVI
ncbi:HEPN domain-containing protein [Streptomyces sp. NPDC088358]|uniref:ApeA N-terminal domain 1-containing protein n=1 Tax=Streptomyces sp. NPDC088358 TaxID=3365857 RepID=UPI0037F931E7